MKFLSVSSNGFGFLRSNSLTFAPNFTVVYGPNETVNEGGLDGSVWLGLDRRSFLATAWIKQGQLLDVIGSAEVLQTHLQRAIATCAANSPGAKALQLIESFRAEHVGDDRANTRPLYRVIRRVESLKSSMDAAKAEHVRYLQLMASETEE